MKTINALSMCWEKLLLQTGMCIKGLIWSPLEPKIENGFSPISFDLFIRRITEV